MSPSLPSGRWELSRRFSLLSLPLFRGRAVVLLIGSSDAASMDFGFCRPRCFTTRANAPQFLPCRHPSLSLRRWTPDWFSDGRVRFAAKRRRTLLQQARDMALGDYHNSVEVIECDILQENLKKWVKNSRKIMI